MRLTSPANLRRHGYSEATRDKLLEAAGRAFAERGFAAATIRDICKEAGANVAAVNYYFQDKLALYAEVLRQVTHASNVARVRVALDGQSSPEEALREAIRARLRGIHSQQRPDWHFRIAARELAQPTPAMSDVIDQIMRPLYGRLCEVVGQIIGRPSSHEQTRLCVHSIIGQLMHYVLGGQMIQHLWPEMQMKPEQIERVADHIADFSLAYLHQQGASNRRGLNREGARSTEEKHNERPTDRRSRAAKGRAITAK